MYYLHNIMGGSCREPVFTIGDSASMTWWNKKDRRVHIFALGDVGAAVLMGLRLMGGDCIREIGIYDVRENVPERWEFECNQIISPDPEAQWPEIHVVKEEDLFRCDVFLFCASLGIPKITETDVDVRMVQLEANAGLVREIAGRAVREKYTGLFGVVSDPVDPLCKTAVLSGLPAERVKGFGLGVMNARACYYARKDHRFSSYLRDGRAFGPHGEDLVIANSMSEYDRTLSGLLTDLTAHANMKMRGMGFKPYVAPAMSSAALSVCALLRGEWHYSSVWMNGAFFGCRNRCTAEGIQVENPQMPEDLYERCRLAYENLLAIRLPYSKW